MLQRSDPFKQRRFANANCLLCRTDRKGSCRGTGVTYELVCQACKSKYVGETSRSAYIRGREHFHALKWREESSVMWKHCCERHERNEVSFVMNVTGIFCDDLMLRQITESVLINKVEEGELINSKNECNYVSIPRAVVTLWQVWRPCSERLFFVYSYTKHAFFSKFFIYVQMTSHRRN